MRCFPLALWMHLSQVNDFITSSIGHLENIGLLSYADNPDIETFHYTTSKIIFVKITSSLISEVFKYWKAIKFMVVDTSFPRSQVLLESSNFIIGSKYRQVFFLKWQAYFIF